MSAPVPPSRHQTAISRIVVVCLCVLRLLTSPDVPAVLPMLIVRTTIQHHGHDLFFVRYRRVQRPSS